MKNRFFVLILGFSLLVLHACQKEPANTSTANEGNAKRPSTLAEKIHAMGFDTVDMLEHGDYYLVEGDVLLPKSLFDEMAEEPVEERQWHTNNLCTTSTIFVGWASDLPQVWIDATKEAMTEWNNLLGCRITFVEHQSNYDIYIDNDDDILNFYTIAAASYPLPSGAPGPTIIINTDFDYLYCNFHATSNIPPRAALRNMVHEFGHCIGFRHTNWQALGEPVGLEGANLINGTPQTDDISVMNGETGCLFWSGFSPDDIEAAETLYPAQTCISSGLYDDWLIFPNVGAHTNTVTVTWNPMKYNATNIRLELLYQDELYQWINYTANYAPAYAPNGVFLNTVTPNDGSHTVDLCYLAHEGGGFRFRISSVTNPCVTDRSLKPLILSSNVECM